LSNLKEQIMAHIHNHTKYDFETSKISKLLRIFMRTDDGSHAVPHKN
jgi:hypothetical protein